MKSLCSLHVSLGKLFSGEAKMLLLGQPVRQALAALSLGTLVYATTSPSWSVELPKKQFVYNAGAKRLPDVLQDFGAVLDVPVIVSDGVEGTVNGKFDLTPVSFLDLMSSAFGLTWYFDGTALFVYPARASQSKVILLRDFGVDRINRLLQTLKLGDHRFPLRYDPQEKTLVVSGPPRHIELVTLLVDALSEKRRDDSRHVVQVFPLKYASSGDQKVGNNNVTGLATLLNQVYGDGHRSQGGVSSGPKSANASGVSPLQAMYGVSPEGEAGKAKFAERTEKTIDTLGSTFSLGSAKSKGADPASARSQGLATQARVEEDHPVFTSDDANNAIIVMGLPENMATYAGLIKQLDIVSDLIELEATIVDVSRDDALALGINWSAKNQGTELGYSDPSAAALNGNVFQLTTISADLTRKLLLAVDALQQAGKAKVIARPRVLGAANRLAVMKDTRSASIRVAGNLSTNLYQVETGTQIEVIPRRMTIDGIHAIKLALSIQDGGFDTTTVDAIPVVKRTEISTEAYVSEGDGLLIGGISSDAETTGTSGVPGLSNLPVFGALFRTTSATTSRRERLFLITPRVIRLARRTAVLEDSSSTSVTSKPAFKMSSLTTAPRLDEMTGLRLQKRAVK